MKLANVVLAMTISAATLGADTAEDRQLADKLVGRSVRVFQEIQKANDKAIPNELLEKARGLVIMPSVKRAGFIFGGKFGKGVFLAKTDKGWSAPSFVRLEGGSFGAQIGAGETDVILVVMNDEGVRQVAKSGVRLGGDITAAAGPVGRSAEAATTPIPTSGLLAYSRARGLFAGISLEGTTLRSDDDVNAAVYGKDVTQEQILSGTVPSPPVAVPLQRVVARYYRAARAAD